MGVSKHKKFPTNVSRRLRYKPVKSNRIGIVKINFLLFHGIEYCLKIYAFFADDTTAKRLYEREINSIKAIKENFLSASCLQIREYLQLYQGWEACKKVYINDIMYCGNLDYIRRCNWGSL